MEEKTWIATPENVELELELAGLGSRFLALCIDTLIEGALTVAILLPASIAFSRVPWKAAGSFPALANGLAVLAVFLIRWGYFIFFEVRLRGQTPGKKLMGIRVIRENGLPLGIRQGLIRNLLRVVDSLPQPLCLVGIVAAFASRKGQRLGDLAAGTVVVRERFRRAREVGADTERLAGWVTRLEEGHSRSAVVLPRGRMDIRQVALIQAYFARQPRLSEEQRSRLSWQIAMPLLPLFGHGPDEWERLPDRLPRCEALLQEALSMAATVPRGIHAAPEEDGERETPAKARLWAEFPARMEELLKKGKRGLARLSPAALAALLSDYRQITSDLARAQSMGADPQTLRKLNRMAVGGHMVIYGHLKTPSRAGKGEWWAAFPRTIRSHSWALALSACLFFFPALISSLAVARNPAVAYDLVGPEFYDFTPASEQSLHRVPQLMRPVVATSIMSNNLQVAIFCFAFGLSAGVGTAYLLVMNGVRIGAVVGWLGANGSARAVWGWVLPHGTTEILAILIAGAAGLLIAKAILAPGQLRRATALKAMALKALILELGCMAMLAVAGLIEGFVSPSSIGFEPRMLISAAMVLIWAGYYLAGTLRQPGPAEGQGPVARGAAGGPGRPPGS